MNPINIEPLIIAEIGVNHNGDINKAKELIEQAFFSGADAVKFQTFSSNLVVSKNTDLAAYQKRSTNAENQYELIKKLELSNDDFIDLKKYSDLLGIEFISTPFDQKSLVFLVEELKVDKLKLSSIIFFSFSTFDSSPSTSLRNIDKGFETPIAYAN